MCRLFRWRTGAFGQDLIKPSHGLSSLVDQPIHDRRHRLPPVSKHGSLPHRQDALVPISGLVGFDLKSAPDQWFEALELGLPRRLEIGDRPGGFVLQPRKVFRIDARTVIEAVSSALMTRAFTSGCDQISSATNMRVPKSTPSAPNPRAAAICRPWPIPPPSTTGIPTLSAATSP